jgi:hypothetical protein
MLAAHQRELGCRGSCGGRSPGGLARATALGLALTVLLGGCGGVRKAIDRINRSQESYAGLQSFIHDELTTKFHRSVRSVSCTPHVDQVLPTSTARLTCVVRFADGTSYTTPATITDPSNDPDTAVNHFSFQDPPATDITTAPLPSPTVGLAAASPASLFRARNLAKAIGRLAARIGRHDLFIQLAIYPGEIEAVVAGSGGEARAVSASYAGPVTVGPSVPFSGSRNGISFAQLVPAVIQRLAAEVAARGGVPVAHIGRFQLVNSLPGGNSGWDIYPASGARHFRSLILGEHLAVITPRGKRPLT